jgi:sodium-coupled neutral amino acid transporter 11
MLIFAFGAQVAYTVVIGDTIPFVLSVACSTCNSNLLLIPFMSRTTIMIVTSTFLILPLCLLKDISTLSKTSFFSVIVVGFLVLIILFYSPIIAIQQHIPSIPFKEYFILRQTVFGGIGTLSFAFVCQHNSFIVFRSLEITTLDNWKLVAQYSITLALVLCSVLGISGYLSFLDDVQGNILNNFQPTDSMITIARILLACNMILTYPQECLVSRHCVLSLIDRLMLHYNQYISKDSDDDCDDCILQESLPYSSSRRSSIELKYIELSDSWLRIPVTLGLWLASLLIAVCFLNLGIVLEITGAVAGSIIGFVLPATIHIYRWRSASATTNGVVYWYQLVPAALMVIFGLLSMFAGIITVCLDDHIS